MQLTHVLFNSVNYTVCSCGDIVSTDDTSYLTFNFILIIFLMPVISSFGIYTNLVNLCIFTRPPLNGASGNFYLTGLSLSDLCVVFTGMFIFCIDSARTYLDNLDGPVKVLVRYILPFGYTAQTCSVYFTVAAAVDCYISTCHSGKIKLFWCTSRRAVQVLVSIGLLSFVYNIIRIWQFEVHDCYSLDNDLVSLDSLILEADNVKSEVCATSLHAYINEAYNVYSYMVLMTFLPFAALIVLNVLIMRQIRKGPAGQPLVDSAYTPVVKTPDSSTLETAEEPENPITMVMVVLLFLACNTLALVINIVENFFEVSPKLINYLADVSNFLVILNSSVNFIIYMMFNRPYRDLFASHCCGVRVANSSGMTDVYVDTHIPMSQSYITAVTNGSGSSVSRQKRRETKRNFIRSDYSPIMSGKSKTEAWLTDVTV